jgi:tetratricopeptide (TPR) repeat protein
VCAVAARYARTESGRFFVMSALTETGQYEMGLSAAQAMIEDYPGANWHYYRLLAKNYRGLGRFDESLAVYDTAMELFPENWWPYSHRCFYTALLTGDAASSLDLCDRALALNPHRADVAHDRRAFARLMAGDLEGAEADLEIAVEGFAAAGDSYAEERLETRTRWLETLRAGGNPLTREEIIEERARYMPAELATQWRGQ